MNEITARKMKRISTTLLIVVLSAPAFCKSLSDVMQNGILYNRTLNHQETYPEIQLNNVKSEFTNKGLAIFSNSNIIQLDKYYSLSERMIRYHIQFGDHVEAVFRSNTGDFNLTVNVTDKTLSIETDPFISKKIDFINSNDDFLIEIYHQYQCARVRIINVFTGETAEITAQNDGPGGHGVGVLNTGLRVGMQHDYYCFGLVQGDYLLVKQITVSAIKSNLSLLLYGDSITEPEDYFPSGDFPRSWTQLIMKNVKGESVSSGRGGCTINEVLLRIRNELPYVKAKYVMVTIGTNGGNTYENLCELVEYIISLNSIPILNNIPCNESQTHINANKLIEIVRQKYKIKGVKFDLATSLEHDGITVDRSTMFHEDYTGSWGQIYHHPNVSGSARMFIKTLIDTPEIFQ